MLLLTAFGCVGSLEGKELKSFSFGYSSGSYMDSGWTYELILEDGVYKARVKPDHISLEEAEEYAVDRSFAEKVEELLIKHKAGRWDGFNRSDKYVLDGDTFHLYVHYTDGAGISAHGYMKWPRNYKEVKGDVEALFHKLRDESKQN